MSVERLRSVPLRIVLPVAVLTVLSLSIAAMSFHGYFQLIRAVDEIALGHLRGEMARTARVVAAALANGDLPAAEREVMGQGVDSAIEALAVLDDQGRVMYATRHAWKGRPAAQVLSAFEEGYLHETRFSWGDNPFGMGPVGTCIREGRPSVIADVLSDQRFAPWQAAARVHGYASVLGLPLAVGNEVFGALAVYAAEPEAFGPPELELLAELADTLAYGLTSLRFQTALADREEQLRRLNAELEQRVVASTQELRETNRELESFTYSVSHDLRSPLRSIDGFSRILLDRHAQQLDPQARHYLERVRAASQRMGQLIDNLLDLSRIGRSALTPVRVDLSALAERIVADLRERDPERAVEVVIEPRLIAWCDQGLIWVALENLLGNAWKYTGAQPHACIELGCSVSEGGAIYFVRDNGAGFDMKYADKLFAPFQRLHRADEFEGSGIGLATVQRVIHRHGGRIWADAAPGQGATFYFTLGA